MRKFILVLFTLVFSTSSFANDGYGSCYIENGKSHLLFCSKNSDSGSGTGSFEAFDKTGRVVDSDNIVIWIGIAVSGCDEVHTKDVPEDAVGCSFNLHN